MVKQIIPLQSMEEHIGADIHTVGHGEYHITEGGHALKEAADCGKPTQEPMERSQCGSRFSGWTCSPWGTNIVAVCS